MFIQGQCIIGCVPFKDGTPSLYRRPYLVVHIDDERQEVHILNISSIAGKEHKLNFPSNIPLNHSMPPLTQASFVKVDSCQQISFQLAQSFKLMSGGELMQADDLAAVLEAYEMYKQK